MNKLSKGISIAMSASMLVSNGTVLAETVKGNDVEVHEIEGSRGTLTLDGGNHTVILKNTKVEAGIERSAIEIKNNAKVTIILKGDNILNGYSNHPAIWVQNRSSLTIEGDGSLEANAGWTTSGLGAAGIGGGYGIYPNFGDITIKSGTVIAKGSKGGAGIGGGRRIGISKGNVDGNITINGGHVIAESEKNGSGIGAGENDNYTGTVTISGGAVYAKGVKSIGCGKREFEDTKNGVFSTGTNGNAVIVAPNGIGAFDEEKNSGIFVTSKSDENSVKVENETITFDDNDADIKVYGNPKMDKNIVINKDTKLEIGTTKPSTLTMIKEKTLTNNGEIVVSNGSSLALEGGKEKTDGNGTLTVNENGKVLVPLTESMISLSNADNLVYDEKEKTPNVNVEPLNLWEYNKKYDKDTDYDVKYENNINASNEAKVIVSAKEGGSLLNSSCTKYFTIGKAAFDLAMPSSWFVKKGEDKLLDKLPKPTNDTTLNGNLKWYLDEEKTTELTNESLKDKNGGDQITIYGEYVHGNSNYISPINLKLDLKIVEYAIPEIKVDGLTESGELIKTYGDEPITVKVEAFIDGNEIKNPAIEYDSDNPEIAEIDSNGKITFKGAGQTNIKVEVKGNDDEHHTSATKNIAVTVNPKQINVKYINIKGREYNGSKEIATDSIKASLDQKSIINGDDVKVIAKKAEMEDANAGKDKKVNIEYKLVGDKESNYKLDNKPDGFVTITKLIGKNPGEGLIPAEISKEQIIDNNKKNTYVFDLSLLVPTDKIGGLSDIVVDDSSVDKKYFEKEDLKVSEDNKTLYIPVKKVNTDKEGNVGVIKVKILGNNFDTTGEIKIIAKNNAKDPSEGGSTGGTTSGGVSSSETDIIGKDRYETAGLIADRVKYYNSVILVNANEALADGLSAAALSGKENAPILLVKKDGIPKATMDRIKNASKVYIVGGENAVSKKVEEQLKGKTIERIGGKNRIETSMLIAKKLGNYNKAFIVNGYKGEADAMSASAAAAKYNAPIILTNGKKSDIDKKSNVDYYAVGGDAVLEDSLVDKYDAERLGGKDRYETNRLVIKELYKYSSKYYYTKGNPLVDALTISLHAKDNGVVLVSPKSDNSILKGKDIVKVGGMNFEIEPIK